MDQSWALIRAYVTIKYLREQAGIDSSQKVSVPVDIGLPFDMVSIEDIEDQTLDAVDPVTRFMIVDCMGDEIL